MTNSMNRWRRSQRGVALIEFALVLPFLLVLTMVVIDFTRAFYVKNLLHTAVREGVRMMAVSTMAEMPDAEARVTSILTASGTGLKSYDVSVDVFPPDAARNVKVSATANFNWLYPGLFSFIGITVVNPTVLEAEAIMRSELPSS